MSPPASVSPLLCLLQPWASRAQPQASRLTRESQPCPLIHRLRSLPLRHPERQRQEAGLTSGRLPVPQAHSCSSCKYGRVPAWGHELVWGGPYHPHLRVGVLLSAQRVRLGGVVSVTEVFVCGLSTGPRNAVTVSEPPSVQRVLRLPCSRESPSGGGCSWSCWGPASSHGRCRAAGPSGQG